MPIIENSSRQVFALPGLKHQTLASAADGLGHLEVWMQSLASGAATPVHYHECEEVVVVLRGAGRLVIAGKSSDFGPKTTLVIAPKAIHQITNTGSEEMFLIAGLSETPAHVFAPDGSLVALPWS
jgi:mannose-6-phosphate isomerase-like protein (cupin superfamily)